MTLTERDADLVLDILLADDFAIHATPVDPNADTLPAPAYYMDGEE